MQRTPGRAVVHRLKKSSCLRTHILNVRIGWINQNGINDIRTNIFIAGPEGLPGVCAFEYGKILEAGIHHLGIAGGIDRPM